MNNIIWSNRVDEILRIGISLEPVRVKNWALSQQEAIQALIQFVELQIPILGGDVYELVNGVIQHSYDNWYCNRLPNEPHLNFVSRSVRKAREYIEHHNASEPDKVFFAFVPEI